MHGQIRNLDAHFIKGREHFLALYNENLISESEVRVEGLKIHLQVHTSLLFRKQTSESGIIDAHSRAQSTKHCATEILKLQLA
jgi:hypothetical protein